MLTQGPKYGDRETKFLLKVAKPILRDNFPQISGRKINTPTKSTLRYLKSIVPMKRLKTTKQIAGLITVALIIIGTENKVIESQSLTSLYRSCHLSRLMTITEIKKCIKQNRVIHMMDFSLNIVRCR